GSPRCGAASRTALTSTATPTRTSKLSAKPTSSAVAVAATVAAAATRQRPLRLPRRQPSCGSCPSLFKGQPGPQCHVLPAAEPPVSYPAGGRLWGYPFRGAGSRRLVSWYTP
ncbi:unnamed protein product, partial [Phaeothamnion confervicola]